MNFIIKLSKSRNSTINVIYNTILVIVNRFIKYAHFISIKEKNTIKQLKFIVLNRMIRYHEISLRIMSDKNKFFTSNY